MRSFITILVAVVVALGVTLGIYAGTRQAQAVNTTWGNIKCQYDPRCANNPKPQPSQEPVDNKNQG